MPYFAVDNLSLKLSDFSLKDISFQLDRGDILVVLGPSGSGKTTLIHSLAGLVECETGRIFVMENEITNLPPNLRNIGIVFQDGALFPHMSVYENIAFGLRIKKKSKQEIRKRVEFLLELVDMSSYSERRIQYLSGGEKQRVALARTLAPEPDIIFFDEPFSALDENLRVRLRQELKNIQRKLGFTAIYVTHDREEAFYLADKIAVMKSGRIIQKDCPEILYSCPENATVASFLGIQNILPVKVKKVDNRLITVLLDGEELLIKKTAHTKCINEGEHCYLVIRPEAGMVEYPGSCCNDYQVEILEVISLTNFIEVTVRFQKYRIKVKLINNSSMNISLEEGRNVKLSLPPDNLHLVKE